MEPPSFLNPNNWKWLPHIPNMNDLMNPTKWGYYMGRLTGNTGGFNEAIILAIIMIILFFVFIWDYIKKNQV